MSEITDDAASASVTSSSTAYTLPPPDEIDGALRDLYKKTHQVIQKVTSDIEERFHFNTAISAVMELVNQMYGIEEDSAQPQAAAVMRHALETAILLLSPIVPHFAEEIWHLLGRRESVLLAGWPSYRQDALVQDEMTIVVQVNGKLRSRFSVGADTDQESLKQMALDDPRVQGFIGDKNIRKVIVVPNKLVNIVV